MIRMLCLLGVSVAMLVLVPSFYAADAKEEKLTGKITCPKCDLKTADACGTVIVVGDKTYTFDKESNKKYHKDICSDPKEGTVHGKVTKDGDKLVISVSKLEYKK
jgi:hypothetical protein